MAVKKLFIKRLNGKYWGYIAYIDGVRRRKFGFSTQEKAEQALYNARVRARERSSGIMPDARPVTIKEIIEDRIKRLPVKKGAPGHHSRKQAVVDLKRFLEMLPGELLAVQLNTAHTARYRDARLEAGLAPQTVFRELTNIQACLNGAREKFPQLESWTCPARPRLKIPKGSRNRIITSDEAGAILAHLRRAREIPYKLFHKEPERFYRARLDSADYLQFTLQTALRPDEAIRRAWSDVLWESSRLRVDATKTDEEATIDLPESCMEMLKRRFARQEPKSKWIFPSDKRRGEHLEHPSHVIIRRAAEAAGVRWGYADNGIVLYTTRHTAATMMLDAGHDLATVQSQTRHSTKTMLMRYGHATARSRRAAASALDSFGVNLLAGSLADVQPDGSVDSGNSPEREKVKSAKGSGKT
jgi:integrase